MQRGRGSSHTISFVIPAYNEKDGLRQLHGELSAAAEPYACEIIYVDDGSTDGSEAILRGLAEADPRVRVVLFARNFGKAEALAAGFRESRGDVVVTLDADLQDDPAELPRLLARLDEGCDLVSGRKVRRQDAWHKVLSSWVFNRVTALLTGVPLHDFNCGFKVYRREVVETVRPYGQLYRFIPALAHWRGFSVAEVEVRHRPRASGRSKYGARRFMAGALDLATVLFLTRFRHQPFYVFGTLGLLLLGGGAVMGGYLSYLHFYGYRVGDRPLLLASVLLVLAGLQSLSLGLIGDLLAMRDAHEGRTAPHYRVYVPGERAEVSEVSGNRGARAL